MSSCAMAWPQHLPEPLLDASYKGYPLGAPPCAVGAVGEQGWNLLDGDLPLPLAVLDEAALAHNLAWMQAYAARKGVWLAPHGKTTLSPQLCARQLAAGAWGLTFASVWQARLGVACGAQRLIIANQVLQPHDLDALVALHRQCPQVRVWFLVDSLAQVACIEAWARQRGDLAPCDALPVLLEMGASGQRCGCRTLQEGLALAHAIHASAVLRLEGMECYEGLAARCDSAHDAEAVTHLVRNVVALARAVDAAGWWAPQAEGLVLTAGGSAVFDLVLPLLQLQGLSRPVQGVLRSGCYVTHDHGNYRRYLDLLCQREGLDARQALRPALTVWALVQSVPEPGLALLNAGRRDVSYDIDLPVPVQRAAAGQRQWQAVPTDWRIVALNDQHAHLRFDPASAPAAWPQVGERVMLGISHPCTTFDKWRWMPVVDAHSCVSSAIHTCF